MPTLDWIGKKKIVNHHLEVPFKVLDKKYTFSVDNQATESDNMIIHGDNLEALKALLPKYEEKIECIYIDPPYNTGEEKWIYNDKANDPQIQKWLNEVVGTEDKDLTRHDKWLCMMYPRLKLLQKLLSPKGCIFISIDENEIHNLLQICVEIFGENNLDTFVWLKTDSKVDRNTNNKIINRAKSVHEYIVVCYKNKNETFFNKMVRLPQWKNKCKNQDKDPRGPWQSGIIIF